MYETKNVPFEIKANTSKRIFEGYASTWEKDLVGDQIVKGAFQKTIAERKDKIKVLWQHGAPIGKPLEMYEDSKGLYVEAYIAKTPLGDEALELMKEGIVDEMSIGYTVTKDEYAKDSDTRFLKELKLFEFSPVTFGANPTTSITNVKSIITLDDCINELSKLDLEKMQKSGRILSKPNLDRIKQAQQHLAELIALMENEELEKNFTHEKLTSIFENFINIKGALK